MVNYMSNKEPFIKWKESYETGHSVIDEQHKKLVEIINNLYFATIDVHMDTNKAFADAIRNAIDYTKYHFQEESKIMELINYSDMENHKNMHRGFIIEIVRQFKNYEDGAPFASSQFIRYLRDWLLEHIVFEDKKLVKEIIEVLREHNKNETNN